jgi:NarL family two-component system response regulator LiaR
MNSLIRVLVVDDHFLVRRGICALLATEPDIEVVGEADDGVAAVAAAARLQPDVILMDLVLPYLDGIGAIQQIRASGSAPRILVLTTFDADDQVFAALRAGALGYTLKNSGPTELLQAIRQVFHGESSLHPSIARKVLQELTHPPSAASTREPLSERELEVLRHVAHGESNQQIGLVLGISEATVRTHVSNILSKLHLTSRTQAALYALRERLASLDAADLVG